ncbi:TonB-dependent receptor [Limibacter armeniacum]|uniref:SusC/RagA family TonB-linked outer membrane protein n=1 Tax=Limibacter armeniacum TaxID=466084 RepID=UPI002FE66121
MLLLKKSMSLLLLTALLCFPAFAQDKQIIRGQISDATTNEPIPGVNILIEKTGQGTVTNFEGKFALNAAKGDLITISSIGYVQKKITVGEQTSFNISLEQDTEALDEVVVVGYGEQKRENITGSVAQVTSEKLTDVTTPTVANMLQGKIAGVNISQSSGSPGASPVIRIRGRSSINSGQDPLWVVDGVIMHGTPYIAPQEIESISVLKDAASAALYGSRAANGVVVVTTKSGNGGKQINFTARYGVSQLNRGNFELMNSSQLYDYYQSFQNPDKIPSWYNEELKNTDTDWFDIGTQQGVVQDYALTFNGGSEKVRTYLTANYYNEEGSVKGYVYDRFNGRFNLDYDVTDWLTIKPKIATSYINTDSRQHSLYALYRNMPWDNPYDEEGNPVNAQEVQWYGRDNSNYLYDLQWNYGENEIVNLIGNFDFEMELTDGLKFISTNNLSYYTSVYTSYTDPRSISGQGDQGRLYNSRSDRVTRFTNQMLSYKKSIGDHFINALVAYEYNDYKYRDMSATGKGMVPGTTVLNTTSQPVSIGGTANDYAFQSYLFNANYSYDNRYSLQFSFRRDGASRFGDNNKYGNFYAISGAWNIHNEEFFNVKHINSLRLKASYGGIGNTPSSLYPQYELYSLSDQYNGSPSAFPSSLGNDDLTWERTFETNFGLEAYVFDILNINFEVYDKNTSELLSYVPLPAVSGFSGYYDNIGAVRNKGIELSTTVDILKRADIEWSLNANWTRNRNEITSLYNGDEQLGGNKIIKEGSNIDTWYMRKWLGVNPDNGAPLWEVVDEETGEVSTTENYAQATLQDVGVSTPDFYGGFGTYFSYKGFYTSLNFNYSVGAMAYNAARETFDSDGAYSTYNQMVLADGWSRWEKPGDVATHPAAYIGGNKNAHKTSSRYLEEADFLRLRNITLGYNLPATLVNKAFMSSANVYLSIDNVFTSTPFSGVDPEAAIYGDGSSLYPLPRKVMIGANISF